ncbi:MAG TPA: hypothetical protein DEB10_12170 [Ruminococcaceae bacterium]|nr:hypothetical protein [Oscillospiraceae bacterium]
MVMNIKNQVEINIKTIGEKMINRIYYLILIVIKKIYKFLIQNHPDIEFLFENYSVKDESKNYWRRGLFILKLNFVCRYKRIFKDKLIPLDESESHKHMRRSPEDLAFKLLKYNIIYFDIDLLFYSLIEKEKLDSQALWYNLSRPNPYIFIIYNILKYNEKKIILLADSNTYTEAQNLLEMFSFEADEVVFNLKEIIKKRRCYDSTKAALLCSDHSKISKKVRRKKLAFYYYKNINEIGYRYRVLLESPLIQNAYHSLINFHLHNGVNSYTFAYEFGYIYGGILLLGFCSYLKKCANNELVFFTSDKGVLLHKIYCELLHGNGLIIPYSSTVELKILKDENATTSNSKALIEWLNPLIKKIKRVYIVDTSFNGNGTEGFKRWLSICGEFSCNQIKFAEYCNFPMSNQSLCQIATDLLLQKDLFEVKGFNKNSEKGYDLELSIQNKIKYNTKNIEAGILDFCSNYIKEFDGLHHFFNITGEDATSPLNKLLSKPKYFEKLRGEL